MVINKLDENRKRGITEAIVFINAQFTVFRS